MDEMKLIKNYTVHSSGSITEVDDIGLEMYLEVMETLNIEVHTIHSGFNFVYFPKDVEINPDELAEILNNGGQA
jgi:hypothetical protein